MKKVMMIVLGLTCSSAAAAPAFKADGFANAFNEAARGLDIDTRFALQKCTDAERDACTFRTGPHIAAIIVKRAPGLTGVLIWDGDKASTADWLLSIGVTMALFSPSVDKDQRAVAMKTMLAGFKGKQKHGETMLDGEKYVLQIVPSVGLWFSVDPAE
jgi:hypothetical protein